MGANLRDDRRIKKSYPVVGLTKLKSDPDIVNDVRQPDSCTGCA